MQNVIAFIKKEFFQILRDPISILIVFILPPIILMIYAYAINLDASKINIGILNHDHNYETNRLIESFDNNNYVTTKFYHSNDDLRDALTNSKVQVGVIIPNDFIQKLSRLDKAQVFVATDGSEANLAFHMVSYPNAIINTWLFTSKFAHNVMPDLVQSNVDFWYNQDINSRHFLLPGSVALSMTLIGIILTSLVIAREYERGTMESLLSTRITKFQFLVGKYIPYFCFGMISMVIGFVTCLIFQVPFRGNFFVFLGVGSLFLITCLGLGLFVSTFCRDQFVASQMAISIAFLPMLVFSGLIFPISSMPGIFQFISNFCPAKYFVLFVQTEFLVGTVWKLVLVNSSYLLFLGGLFFVLTYRKLEFHLE